MTSFPPAVFASGVAFGAGIAAALLLSAFRKLHVLRVEERRGRIRAEKRIRQLTEKGNTGLKRDCDNPTLTFRPIGYVSSSFLERNGCPRQSGVVPSARCILRLEPLLNPTAIVDGLSQFSHVWIVFVFHKNTNAQKSWEWTPQNVIRAKIRPPRLGGKKVGVLSTRSPHRPNAIGLSLGRIERVNAGWCENLGYIAFKM
mmetsp:Transcript_45775/g.118326  ORF Transcript_45775/g.118326 Transcript_45775/m.118326 type:complete len:200 (-) Transcript_45775:27-626(-)